MAEPLYIHLEYRDRPYTRNLVYADRVEYYEGRMLHTGVAEWTLVAVVKTKEGSGGDD
jgi:hypothetical protein